VRYLTIDLSRALRQPLQASPNLPVLTRGSDTACVLKKDGADIIVPHATIAALRDRTMSLSTAWPGDAGVFDVWLPLMSGTMLTIAEDEVAAA